MKGIKLNTYHMVGIVCLVAALICLLVWIFSKKTIKNKQGEDEVVRNSVAGNLSIIFFVVAVICAFIGQQSSDYF